MSEKLLSIEPLSNDLSEVLPRVQQILDDGQNTYFLHQFEGSEKVTLLVAHCRGAYALPDRPGVIITIELELKNLRWLRDQCQKHIERLEPPEKQS